MSSSEKGLRETSSITVQTVLGYVREQGGDELVDQVHAASGLPYTREELNDPKLWVSYDERIRLFEAAAERLGGPQALYEIGRSSTRQNVAPSVVLALRHLGSPAKVYKLLPRMVAKYSTTSTMTLVDCSDRHATFHFRLHEGYVHSRLDCLYAQGLLASTPEGFDLPTARITHLECESDGADACIYHVTWARYSRWSRRRRNASATAELELMALERQLSDLRNAAADLVGGDGLDAVLQRVVQRAATAVLARGYVLAVRDRNGLPLVHAHGIGLEETAAVAERLLADGDLGPAAVVVDIASAQRTYGRLAALHGEGQEGVGKDFEALQGYARHAAAALDMMTALEDSRRDAERARALLHLSQQLTEASSPSDIAELIAASLPTIVNCDNADVWLWDDSSGLLTAEATAGTIGPGGAVRGAVLDPAQTPELAALLADPQPHVLQPEHLGGSIGRLLDELGLEYSIIVPLMDGDRFLGIATANWVRTPNTAAHHDELLERLRGAGHQAASALRNARLTEQIRRQAEVDDLTGLPNRRVFLRGLERALGRAEASEPQPVAVLFCDLDGFKAVNDGHGHAAGDELLRQVSARLGRAVADQGQLVRLAGDEFAVLMPLADRTTAEQVGTRIVTALQAGFDISGAIVEVTVSVGVALDDGIGDGDRLLRRADAAMYLAKQSGRNQVVVATPAATELAAAVPLAREASTSGQVAR